MEEKQIPSQLFAEERKQEIIRIMQEQKKVIVPQLCDYFGVSASTIRNDLRELEKKKLLTRTHGGAIVSTKTGREYLPENRESRMAVQKRGIGAAALERIEDGDCIAIMTGTTTYELVQLLPAKKNLRIVLNDIRFADWLEKNTDFEILLLGGFLRRNYHFVTSPVPNEILRIINIDKFFISCNGVSLERGITTPDLKTATMAKEVLEVSNEKIVLSDSSKIGRVAYAQIAALGQIDELVTDEGIEDEDLEAFQKVISVTVAPNSAGQGYYLMPD